MQAGTPCSPCPPPATAPFTLPPHYSKDLTQFVALCLTTDPEQRGSVAGLLKHPYMEGLRAETTSNARTTSTTPLALGAPVELDRSPVRRRLLLSSAAMTSGPSLGPGPQPNAPMQGTATPRGVTNSCGGGSSGGSADGFGGDPGMGQSWTADM